ncbi:MAG: two-component system sensor histidine kinase NtrB, partial [Limisphaerales bacterium]
TADLDAANEELQREISLRKQGEEELRKSKEQYRFLFDENPQPMWIFDLETCRFLAFNGAALRHYGYGAAEFRELSVKDLCLPDDVNPLTGPAHAPPEAQRHGLCRHLKKDGVPIEVEITSLDLVYAARPARLVLAHDVTAQRQLQKQLLQAQKMEITNQLAGGVADNFSRLILLIEEDANLLVRKSQEPELAKPLKRIAATASSAGGLTRQLMALVRRHPIQVEPVELDKFIESRVPRMARLLGKKISLETICRTSLPPIVADPSLLDQILHNLILNGRDAMQDGGTLTLSMAAVRMDESQARSREDARPGAFVCLTVADTGCGMTPEIKARLFEPFFTTKATKRASGLGLATVHGLIKQHAGWIEVNSQPGAGSKFSVFLPCGQLAVASRGQASARAHPRTALAAVTVS